LQENLHIVQEQFLHILYTHEEKVTQLNNMQDTVSNEWLVFVRG